MENLEKELEKLFCYTMDQEEIRVEDVDAICTTQISNRIFDMVESVAKQEKKRALDCYYDLLALKEPPMRILYMLTRQFKILLEVRELMQRGMGRSQIAKAQGVPPFVAGKYMDQCRNFSKADLREIMEEGADLETDVKTGRLDEKMSVEIFIMSALEKGRKA
jgi:DNA polymerase-3 subunit delta